MATIAGDVQPDEPSRVHRCRCRRRLRHRHPTATAVYVVDRDSVEVFAYDLATGDNLWSVELDAGQLTSVDVTEGAIALTTPTELILLST